MGVHSGRRRSGRSRRRQQVGRSNLRVHPDFHRHLLLVCLALIVSWVLPGAWVQLSGFGFLYLTALLGLRLGPLGRLRKSQSLHLNSTDTRYLLLAIATGIAQLVWLFSPASLQASGVPLLALFTLFIVWSMVRLMQVLAKERRIDGRILAGATAGYLLLGISGGLLLTVLDSIHPDGFYDNFTHQSISMPHDILGDRERMSWDLNYGRLSYFAFVSLTTLGYGDITPVVPLTRLACLALSVVGPLYIAVVLGVLISRLNPVNPQPPPASPQPEAPRSAGSLQPSPQDRPASGPSHAPAGPGPGPDGSAP